MMPLDVAMKLSSASTRCEKHKCPFMSQCKGDYTTCIFKEVALIIRSQAAEIETLKNNVRGLQELILGVHRYTLELEKINKRYHDIVLSFQRGYRPKAKVHRASTHHFNKSRTKIKPEDMDGDERFAQDAPPAHEPAPPRVVI